MSQPLGVFDLSNAEYHASEGLSRSKLWTFKQLPYKFWYEYLSGQYHRPCDSDAFVLGDLVHTLTLESHLMNERYVKAPEIDRRTKQGKIDYLAFAEESQGKVVVRPDMFDQALDMHHSISENTMVFDLLNDSMVEKSIYWRHEPTGLICKARPDIWQPKLSIVSDLKTTRDAGLRGFQSSSYTNGYFLQAAMIYEALKSIGEPFQTFVFICVEKTKPYSVGIYLLDDEALQFGVDMFHALMERIAICFDKGIWPDYGVQKLTIPNYATMETEIE